MDRKNLFPIGEVSRLFHISVSSLRHYENIGLLSPEYISPDSGYRYYGPEQFEVLNTIRYLRVLDMPLSEIEDSLKNKDIDLIEEKLRQQKQAVLKKQQELYDGIFLILDQEDIYTGETLELPETLCVRLRFHGSHAESPAQYQKLLHYIDRHKMQIVGFSREVTLIDYGITNDTEKFVTEICIPVKCE